MKVKIITIHDPDVNYGSTLQSCGTYNFVKSLGYDVKLIDYKPNYKSLPKRLKKQLVNIVFHDDYKRRRKKIDAYFLRHANFTKHYHSYEALVNDTPTADVYITGSDVIWNRDVNPEGADPAFYLGFVKNGVKMSYGPSMGEVQSESNISFIFNQIKDFRYISVREERSREQLLAAGLSDVQCVTDPVFLLDCEYYESQVLENKYGEYTLVYLMSETEDKRKKVQDIGGNYGDKIISFGGFKQKCDCDMFIRDAGVEEFLSLIYHAKHIVTDSFHCICFSLMFEKQFVYLPSIDSSMRIENILDYVNLRNRVIHPGDSLDIIQQQIDYFSVTPKLREKVDFSRNYLKGCLRQCEEDSI